MVKVVAIVVSRYAEADLVTPDSSTGRGDGHGQGAARTSYRAVRFAHQDLMERFYRCRRSTVADTSNRLGSGPLIMPGPTVVS